MPLNLKDKEWKVFEIRKIFDTDKGVYLHQKNITRGDIPYITAKSINNGLHSLIGNSNLFNGNCITVEKINLSAYYQEKPFYCSHDVSVISNAYLNRYNAIFICSMINRQGFKYSYGRQAQLNVVKEEKILLPINAEGEPDYAFMEQYVREQETKKANTYKAYITKRIAKLDDIKTVEALSVKEWKEFFITDVFTKIQRGKRLKKDDHIKGDMPYVSSTAINNGVDGFIRNKEKVRMFKNCLTLANSGSVGATFYQPFQLVASDHVTKLENENYNKYVYLFIAHMVSRLSEKYSFNREINDTRIKREKIMLPVNLKGEPDYDYMEQYMKALEYKKLKVYLDWKN